MEILLFILSLYVLGVLAAYITYRIELRIAWPRIEFSQIDDSVARTLISTMSWIAVIVLFMSCVAQIRKEWGHHDNFLETNKIK